MLAQRTGLAPAEREGLGVAAQEAIITSAAFGAAQTVLLYIPIRGEVPTDRIAAAALAQGKRLVLPRVQAEPKKLWLHAWSGRSEELVTGAYGILEPGADWPLVPPGEIDLVVVPGVAFDRQGVRLGYGGGYYDRTLPSIRAGNPRSVALGLAYGFQVVTQLPAGPYDQRMDGVATEAGIWWTESCESDDDAK